MNLMCRLCFNNLLGEIDNLALSVTSSPVSSLTPSSGMSEDLDHQEIQLALQNAKLAARNKIRSRFHSSSDLIHRLFVCISGKIPRNVGRAAFTSLSLPCWYVFWHDAGVADQLQTNYASDLRSILKTLFEVMATKCEEGDNDNHKKGEERVLGVQHVTVHCHLWT